MISVSQIIDSASLAIARLVSQFKTAPRITGMITAISNECQAVEDALWDVYTEFRDYTVATGDALDKIGDLVGAPVRGPRNDASYQHRVAGQVIINRSSGESASIYGIAKNLVDAWDVTAQPITRKSGIEQFTIGCAPTTTTLLPSPSGLALGSGPPIGTLTNGTYGYRVSALTGLGETLACAEVTITLAGGTSSQCVIINWTGVPGATSYRVYGRTSGSELFMILHNATASTAQSTIDTGAAPASGALPSSNTAALSLDDSTTNNDAEARELANVLHDSASAGVRAIVFSRDALVDGGFFRFAGGTAPGTRGFDVGALRAAYDR